MNDYVKIFVPALVIVLCLWFIYLLRSSKEQFYDFSTQAFLTENKKISKTFSTPPESTATMVERTDNSPIIKVKLSIYIMLPYSVWDCINSKSLDRDKKNKDILTKLTTDAYGTGSSGLYGELKESIGNIQSMNAIYLDQSSTNNRDNITTNTSISTKNGNVTIYQGLYDTSHSDFKIYYIDDRTDTTSDPNVCDIKNVDDSKQKIHLLFVRNDPSKKTTTDTNNMIYVVDKYIPTPNAAALTNTTPRVSTTAPLSATTTTRVSTTAAIIVTNTPRVSTTTTTPRVATTTTTPRGSTTTTTPRGSTTPRVVQNFENYGVEEFIELQTPTILDVQTAITRFLKTEFP